jgi:hypothetical protein
MMNWIALRSAIAKIPTQCRDGGSNTEWGAAQLALLRDKLAHIIGIHRENYHSIICEFIKQQTRNDSKALSARTWRKPSIMAHIHIEAA